MPPYRINNKGVLVPSEQFILRIRTANKYGTLTDIYAYGVEPPITTNDPSEARRFASVNAAEKAKRIFAEIYREADLLVYACNLSGSNESEPELMPERKKEDTYKKMMDEIDKRIEDS